MERAWNLTQPCRSVVPRYGQRDDLEENRDNANDETLGDKLVEGSAIVCDVELFRGEKLLLLQVSVVHCVVWWWWLGVVC